MVLKMLKVLPSIAVAAFLVVGCNDDDPMELQTGETDEVRGTENNWEGDNEEVNGDEMVPDEAEETAYGTPEHQNPAVSDYRFANPVIYADRPDPSVFHALDGVYYLYSTGSYLHMHSSEDLVHWTDWGNVFRTRPDDATYLWAPDMEYFDDHYVLYYTCHVSGVYSDYVNVATATRPTGTFTDQGTVVSYTGQGVINSIDQCFWEDDDGSKWLFWGSFNGIYAIQLSDDGLSVRNGAGKTRVVGTLTEGTMIYKRNGWYYLIGSAGWYDGGASSTYHLVVARSESLLGPYVDRDGKLATDNYMSEFLNASDEVYGPGHNSEILEMPDGTTWFVYHGWPADNPDYGRVVYLSQIFWDNTGWPYVVLDKPSVTWDKPSVTSFNFTYTPVDYVEFIGSDIYSHFLYDTGYVPNANTRVELKFRSYPEDPNGNSTTGYTRRVFQANESATSGFSLYISSDGKKFGYSNYGYDTGDIADHEFLTDYEISATLTNLTINGESFAVTSGSVDGKWSRITFFSGPYDYPFKGRIYYFKIYEDNKLIHDFEPVLRNQDSFVMFHDTVSGSYFIPYDADGFSYGNKVN